METLIGKKVRANQNYFGIVKSESIHFPGAFNILCENGTMLKDIESDSFEIQTKVKFLIHPEQNNLFAFFYETHYDYENSGLFVSYEKIGQHSACSVIYANESRYATEQEYSELKKELESIGYYLEVTEQLEMH